MDGEVVSEGVGRLDFAADHPRPLDELGGVAVGLRGEAHGVVPLREAAGAFGEGEQDFQRLAVKAPQKFAASNLCLYGWPTKQYARTETFIFHDDRGRMTP